MSREVMTGGAPSMTLASLLISAIRRHGTRPAITCDGTTLTYEDLDQTSSSIARALHDMGVTGNDVVALHLRNSLEYVIADLAILKLGAAKCPLNELMSREELGYCVASAKAKVLIRHASLPEPEIGTDVQVTKVIVEDASPATNSGSLCWSDLLLQGAATTDETFLSLPGPDDIASLSFTGGTTGKPKCVVHSQARLGLNLFAHMYCGDVRSDEVMLLTTPLPHSAGYHMQGCLFAGGQVILKPKFDPVSVLECCDEYQVTWTFAVPTMLYRLIDTLLDRQQSPVSLRTIVYGAAPMSRERLEQGLSMFGPVFVQLYGQTECPNYITTLSKHDHLRPELLTSCGRAVPFCALEILAEDGASLPAGEVGEVAAASPYLFMEYRDNPEQTAKTLAGGWLRTGDLGYRNQDGYVFLVDRAKDMIITGGMNVYSVEVEAAIRKYSAVKDVAVIGVADADWGEAVTAIIVSDSVVSLSELKAFLGSKLSAYKLPKHLHQVESLPLTPYGKVDKKVLRDRCS